MATFLALVEALIGDPAEKAAYNADPGSYLTQRGFGDLDEDDVRTALVHSSDTFPPRLAATIDPDAGLAPLTDVELQHLGLSGFDDFVAPLPDDLGGAGQDAAGASHAVDELGLLAPDDGPDAGPAEHAAPGHAPDAVHPLHQDVDIDSDEVSDDAGAPGGGAGGAEAAGPMDLAEALDADQPPAVVEPTASSVVDTSEDLSPPLDGSDGPGELGRGAPDPFNDPFADPSLHFDDNAPWMDGGDTSADLDQLDEPDDDILDDVDEHMGR